MMDGGKRPPYAPPFLKAGKLVIAQTALILHYLGPRLRLVPRSEADRLWAHQLQLTITDLVKEIHDTHHPISSQLYYEDQRPAAKRYTREFWQHRVPKLLGYFEDVLGESRGPFVFGRKLCYVDLSLFQIVEGLRYAFPKRMKRFEKQDPAPGRAARPCRRAAAHRRLPAIGAPHCVQRMGHLPRLQGARRLAPRCARRPREPKPAPVRPMSQDDVFLLGFLGLPGGRTVLLRSVLAAAGGALILAVGLCSPALATTPEMPDGQQPPAVEQVEPKPAEPAKKPDCVTNETAFKQNGEQPVFEVALENSCDMRLKCTVDLTVMGSRGVAQGRGTLRSRACGGGPDHPQDLGL